MASSVFFRFKSQKEPTRVAFDGTGISVFELKREIILSNRLGDGTDFELVISAEDTGEEYDDDTYAIPRSTTVIAKRLPALKPGRGGAARYVSGKMPQSAKTSHRADTIPVSSVSTKKQTDATNGIPDMNGAQTEDEKIAAMFKLGADQWAQQQVEMANATPVYRSGPSKGKPANVPDRPPPQGYVCYRCGEKGHWIQGCPTNDDPSYVNRPRVKRTTGIPRSFLKTVEKPATMANDGTVDETKQPSGIMVNADGEWVVAEPDKASWDQYQARAKVSAAAQEAAARGNKALQERGLECPIDKRLFVEPSKTPCCQTTYCFECITNALLENDLRCPQCDTENILLDDLKPDKQAIEHIRAYEHEQQSSQYPKAGKFLEQDMGHENCTVNLEVEGGEMKALKKPLFSTTADSPSQSKKISMNLLNSSVTATGSSKDSGSKKRLADSTLANTRTPPPPGTERAKHGSHSSSNNANLPSSASTPALGLTARSLGPTITNTFTNRPTDLMPSMPMGVYDPMMMMNPMMAGNGTHWNAIWNGTFPQQSFAMANGGYPNGMQNGQFGAPNMQMPMNNGYAGLNDMGTNISGRGTFSNQQRNHFAGSKANEEDSAYFRKPVNPHRHQGRRNVNRPADYREV
ncbi:MAG: hypothetical protein Q9170_001125 [Blastenia crenularia]